MNLISPKIIMMMIIITLIMIQCLLVTRNSFLLIKAGCDRFWWVTILSCKISFFFVGSITSQPWCPRLECPLMVAASCAALWDPPFFIWLKMKRNDTVVIESKNKKACSNSRTNYCSLGFTKWKNACFQSKTHSFHPHLQQQFSPKKRLNKQSHQKKQKQHQKHAPPFFFGF